jgi:type IV secretion system protein VirB10
MNNVQNTSTQLEAFDGERGIPSVNDYDSRKKNGLIILTILLVVCLGAGAAYWKFRQKASRDEIAQKPQNMTVTSAVPARTFGEPPAQPSATSTPSVELPSTPTNTVVPSLNSPPLPGSTTSAVGVIPTLDKSGSALMAGNTAQRQSAPDADQLSKGNDPRKQVKAEGVGALSAMLSSTQTPARAAGHLGKRNFMLAKGSFIDCALQTKLDSTVPGMTACVVTRNIYSDNGKVLLVERGSTVTGEYQANMRQGMARIYVLWSRIKTPKGIIINLDSPGTDQLGGSGVPGWVDNHFWERFGGAIMLSLVDDIARVSTQSAANGNNGTINLSSTGGATQNAATEALRNSINIPPTLYKNQGEQVGIYIARDLDFSSVYDVSTSND